MKTKENKQMKQERDAMAMKICLVAVSLFAQMMTAGLSSGQVVTHGPVVGGVTASTANVFVRTDQAANVAVQYGIDPTLGTYLISTTLVTSSANDFTKIIPLANLTADTTYYMNVVVNGVPQSTSPPYPSFTTFAPGGTSRTFNFVVLTDFETTRNLTGPVQTFASAAAEYPAFVFIGGDFDHRNPQTLPAKRQMFKDLYNANTPYIGDFVNLILQKTAIIHQWDDHDSGPNNCDKSYIDWNLTQQVFQEYVPSYPLPSVTPGIWQKFSYAQVDGFVLDCRSQRDPEEDPDDANKSMLDGNNLGSTGELQWLENGLVASTAIWKVIFTSVVTNPTTKFPDAWSGYQTEWNALRNFIETNNITGVVFISGDLHLGAIDNGTAAGFPEMCVAQPNGIGGCPTYRPPGIWSEGYDLPDACEGFGLVTILENPDRLILQAVDEYGNIHISYTVEAPNPTPTPSPSATPTPTSTPTPTPTPTPTSAPTVQVTVQTNAAGSTFTVDGTNYSSTQTFSWASGSSHTIATTSPQSGGTGIQYLWARWSDNGAISHTISPTTNKTYTAIFKTQYYLTMSSGTGGNAKPASGWKNSGTTVSITARPANGYSFSSWSGSGTGSYSGTNNPASITMSGPITETATFSHN